MVVWWGGAVWWRCSGGRGCLVGVWCGEGLFGDGVGRGCLVEVW